MRLTLRTLLAWLDGVLPPEEQQQLGAKVSSSSVATMLVDRIRTAVARTTIGAPKPLGRGLTEDPNSVAEYLDNTLSAEQLESFERICIESEVHLAEVAACHALLAEVVHEPDVLRQLPVDERQRIHQRLLGLLAGLNDRAATEAAAADRGDGDHRESRETARAIREALAAAGGNGQFPSTGGRGGVAGTPPVLPVSPGKKGTGLAWAVAATGLLVALAGGLLWLLTGTPTGVGRRPIDGQVAALEPEPLAPPADRAAEAEPVVAPAHEVAETSPPSPSPAPPPSPPGPAMASQADRQAGQGAGEAGADGGLGVVGPGVSPPAGQNPAMPTVPQASPPAVAVAAVPSAPLEAPAAQPGPPAPAPVATPTPPPADGGPPQEPVGFVGGEGVLLRMIGAADTLEWTVFPVGSVLNRDEDLLVPRGFQPELHVRGVTIRLLPETRAVLSIDADGTPRIEVVFGRAVARASRADARLGISAAGLTGTVEAGLLSPVAVEVELDRAPGTDPADTPPHIRGRVFAASRGLSWRQTSGDGGAAAPPLAGIDAQGMLEAGTAIEWDSVAADRVQVVRDRGLPPWIESGVRADRFEKAAAEALAAKLAATTPLTRALRELAADKRVENRMLAASTLALLGDFDDVVEQLAAESAARKLEPRQWSQLQAGTVPLALARGGAVAARLHDALVDRGPHGKADALWAMARGLTDEELAAGADRGLVEALEDPTLIVRRFASQTLVDITQPTVVDRNRYRADSSPDMRREGVVWWRGQLEKGLIRRSPAGRVEAGRAVGTAGSPGAGPVPMASPDAEDEPDPDAR